MFTGLIADVGKVEAIDRDEAGARLRIDTSLAGDLSPGDSIAIDGVCLTAVDPQAGSVSADVMNATLERTTLGDLQVGDAVNAELALRAADRLGGHLVQGHVDATAEVSEVVSDGAANRVRFSLDPELRRYVAERGSVAISGVSLTVSAVSEEGFEVSLIPETRSRTTLGTLEPGDRVNVEVDVIARYAERLLADGAGGPGSGNAANAGQ